MNNQLLVSCAPILAFLTFLLSHLRRLPAFRQSGECTACGGEGFIICHDCGGDKKALRLRYGKATSSTQVHHDLKCTQCNENGLLPCPVCMG